jgi:type II secretory pathway component PulF
MAVFQYRGLDKSGRAIAGTMAAEDAINLEEKLRAGGYWLLAAEMKSQTPAAKNGGGPANWSVSWGTGVKRRDLIEFCTMMNFQSRAGVPLVQALKVVADDCDNPRFKKVIRGLHQHLEAGMLLNEAMAEYPQVFTRQMTSVLRAGELGADLPGAFHSVRSYLEWLEEMIRDVRQASIYPMIVLTVVCAFVLLLFSFVIPKFVTLLDAAHVPLPRLTQIVFGASDFAKTTWWMWPLGAGLVAATIKIGCRTSAGFRLGFDRLKLKAPVFGELQLMLAVSRFAHNLALLYRSGIPIVTALKLCEDLVGNAVVERSVREMQQAIESGDSISDAMDRHEIFPSLLVRMVAIGETSGNLDVGLQNVSDYYHDVVPRRIKTIFTMVEPALIIFLVVLVGTIAVSIFLPILSLMSAIK